MVLHENKDIGKLSHNIEEICMTSMTSFTRAEYRKSGSFLLFLNVNNSTGLMEPHRHSTWYSC